MTDLNTPCNALLVTAPDKLTLAPKITFHDLPPELRQTVYCLVGTNATEEHEIRVIFSLSQTATDGSGAFDAPALELLDSLQRVSSKFYQEVVSYFTERLFCWVIISVEQPHIYMLRAFRKHTQGHVLLRISHVRSEGLSILSLLHPGSSSIDFDSKSIPAYLKHMDLPCRWDFTRGRKYRIIRDIGHGLSTLLNYLPSLQRFDIDLDIVDCLPDCIDWPEEIRAFLMSFSNSLDTDLAEEHMRTMILHMDKLGEFRNADQVDVRVVWKDIGLRGRMPFYTFNAGNMAVLQQIFMDCLGKRLAGKVKSLTSHV